MEKIIDVSKWFLSKDSMTPKKIQKLCYYAQAWHCALYGTPLFSDPIQAWVHGPVAPALYPVYADYKWNPVPQQEFDASGFSEEENNVLDAVYFTYGGFTGDQLEALTHSEDPWKQARGNLKPWENCSEAISVDTMRDYYRRKYEDSQND